MMTYYATCLPWSMDFGLKYILVPGSLRLLACTIVVEYINVSHHSKNISQMYVSTPFCRVIYVYSIDGLNE